MIDPYRWLEDPDSPATQAWVTAQNARTESFLAAIPQRSAIRDRLTALWNYERIGPPEHRGGWYVYARNDGLQNQAVIYRARTLDGPAEVLVDPNVWSADGTVALNALSRSDDGRLLAYAMSTRGSDWQTWRVRDVATGEDLPDEVPWSKFSGAAWAPDGSGFYYSGYAPPEDGSLYTTANRHHRVWFHRLGTSGGDTLVFDAPHEPEWLFSADVSDDGRWLVVTQSQGTNREHRIFLRDLRDPDGPVRPWLDQFDASYEVIGNDDDTFYVLTDCDAPRGRLVAIRRDAPEPSQWRTLIAESPGTEVLASVSAIGDVFLAIWRVDAHDVVRVHQQDGTCVQELPLPAHGSIGAWSVSRREPDAFIAFSSFTHPTTIFRFHLTDRTWTVWCRPVVTFDPGAFETTQVFYPSKDGTRIPMYLVHRRGLVLDGRHRTYLYGYGGFDISLTPAFSPGIIAWLERGGVFAQPNLRGGGEYGKAWHDAGRLRNKQNVFDDFIAAAEWLIARGYTSRERLAIGGGSNGGLLVGACLTQRPELFGAAVPAVGVLDMLRFHLFTIGWAWTSDYGNPDDPEDREVLLRYSPLHNIRPGTAYPPTLVITADHDDRVAPAHSHKFTQTLQDAQAGSAPILTRIDVNAGHGAGKPTGKVIAEKADVCAFLEQVLLDPTPPAAQ